MRFRPSRDESAWWCWFSSDGEGLGLGADNVAPVQIAPGQAVDEHLRRGHVGGDRNVILVAQAGDIVEVRVQIAGLGIGKKQNHINFVVSDSGADLLTSPVGVGEEKAHRQARGLGHQLARRVGGAHGMLGQNAAVSNAKLHH
ncbi:hypothetical protein SDC9_137390 [bioreactor metagenome]|uniref:Uncharacterized protein n=1 Tax=bioreactor metagenome TaxID=1076179 RepID=A0A645DLU7_9ZZZZ